MTFKDTSYGDLTGQTYTGNVDVSKLNLTSLEGAPLVVNGNFLCHTNKLTSLQFGPTTVTGSYYCSNNPDLKSLKYAPTNEMRDINFEHTGIKNELMEIFENNVIARTYYTVVTMYRLRDIKDKYDDYLKKYEEYKLTKRVNSKGFRALLGIDK